METNCLIKVEADDPWGSMADEVAWKEILVAIQPCVARKEDTAGSVVDGLAAKAVINAHSLMNSPAFLLLSPHSSIKISLKRKPCICYAATYNLSSTAGIPVSGFVEMRSNFFQRTFPFGGLFTISSRKGSRIWPIEIPSGAKVLL